MDKNELKMIIEKILTSYLGEDFELMEDLIKEIVEEIDKLE